VRLQILEGFIIFGGTGMHGFTHEAEKTWISGSFIRDLSIFCILDIILTRAGRMFGDSDSAGKKQQTSFHNISLPIFHIACSTAAKSSSSGFLFTTAKN
jgi:hypothetical protein